MSTDRRDFIKRLGGAFGTLSFCSMAGTAFAAEAEKVMAPLQAVPPDETADDEEFWRWVRHSFSLAINVINLNNAGVSPQPKTVVDALETLQRMTNEVPSLYMWRYVDQPREVLREKLATMAGCPAEEVCITRNATEALDTIIFGIPLERGDEVVISNFDYPHMAEAWKQRQMREGIVLKTVNLQLPSEDKQA
ncbi:MAG: aminotransferase class V-fold PLP-dependent enzyme, partial [Bacteroidota bacterium]